MDVLAGLGDMFLVLLGAVASILGQFVFARWQADRRKQSLLRGLWEELHAVAFDPPRRRFDGFTSQTFDEFYTELYLLPPEVASWTIQYHLRMKHLAGRIGKPNKPSVDDIRREEARCDALLGRLEEIEPSLPEPGTFLP